MLPQHTIIFHLGAKRARQVLFSVLRDACIDGDLSIAEAIEAAKNICARNAVHFYKINLDVQSLALKDSLLSNYVKKGTDADKDVPSLVRVMWVDASGQHRCRVSSLDI